jgi:hypothetical protein
VSLHDLRTDQVIDHTFQNLLRALTLSLELRARYRVFEFEASQDGHRDAAHLFHELRRGQGEQVTDLLVGLQARLAQWQPAPFDEAILTQPTEVAT